MIYFFVFLLPFTRALLDSNRYILHHLMVHVLEGNVCWHLNMWFIGPMKTVPYKYDHSTVLC